MIRVLTCPKDAEGTNEAESVLVKLTTSMVYAQEIQTFQSFQSMRMLNQLLSGMTDVQSRLSRLEGGGAFATPAAESGK